MGTPRLLCCTPVVKPFPSGRTWAHRLDCPLHPGQKVRAEDDPLDRTATLTPAQADRIQPSGVLALRTWMAHPTTCTCAACRYVDDHVDDNDDTILEEV